ncbi:MAG: hypothetical protein IK089_07755 [Oxalobacter sp.]|nr:hypothetical protein [Oxalobacter sp.]
MKQTLQPRSIQHFTLTPKLQQSIKLLQLSSLELNEEIERLLNENPLLERLDDALMNTTRFQGDGSLIKQKTIAPENALDGSPSQPEALPNQDAQAASLEHADFIANECQRWDGITLPDRQQDDERFQLQLKAPPETLK